MTNILLTIQAQVIFFLFLLLFTQCTSEDNVGTNELVAIKQMILKEHHPSIDQTTECLFKKYVELELDTSLIHFNQDLGVLKIANLYCDYNYMNFCLIKAGRNKFYYVERLAEKDCYYRYVVDQKHDTLAVKDYSSSSEIKILNQILLDISKKQKITPSKVEDIIKAIYSYNAIKGLRSSFKYQIDEEDLRKELVALKANPPLTQSDILVADYCTSLFQNPQLHTLMYKEKSGISITIFVVHKNPVPSVQMFKIPTAKNVFIPGADFKMGTQYKDCWDK